MSGNKPLGRLALFGDIWGVSMLFRHLPREAVSCVVAAEVRPQYLEALQALTREHQVPLLIQPPAKHDRYSAFVETFQSLEPDGILCNSYAMKLRPDLLRVVDQNAFNVHASLLPKNRGPNPIQWALIKGEEKTGVTLHVMTAQIDQGDIVAQEEVAIEPQDTWRTLSNKITEKTESLLGATLPDILSGGASCVPQDETLATVNFRLTPDYPEIRFDNMNDWEIYNLIRAQIAPLKGAYLSHEGQRLFFDQRISLEDVAILRQRYAETRQSKLLPSLEPGSSRLSV